MVLDSDALVISAVSAVDCVMKYVTVKPLWVVESDVEVEFFLLVLTDLYMANTLDLLFDEFLGWGDFGLV